MPPSYLSTITLTLIFTFSVRKLIVSQSKNHAKFQLKSIHRFLLHLVYKHTRIRLLLHIEDYPTSICRPYLASSAASRFSLCRRRRLLMTRQMTRQRKASREMPEISATVSSEMRSVDDCIIGSASAQRNLCLTDASNVHGKKIR